MKAHQLAKALEEFAFILRNGPNIEMNSIKNNPILDINKQIKSSKNKNNKDDIPIALGALLTLSKFNKQEWITLINDFGFELEIKPTESSRDVLGKVLKYLEQRPEAREKLSNRIKSRGKQASPELSSALSALINI